MADEGAVVLLAHRLDLALEELGVRAENAINLVFELAEVARGQNIRQLAGVGVEDRLRRGRAINGHLRGLGDG